MLSCVGQTGGNVIEVNHQRAIWLAPLGYTGIELILEVRDEAHAESVVSHLRESGYNVEREGQGEWSA